MTAKGNSESTIVDIERAFSQRKRGEIDAERRAAVSVILRMSDECPEKNGTEVLLIQRTTRPDDPWSGQMAFPGGRIDRSDASSLAAALREAREEVGIDLEQIGRLLGASDDIRAMARGRRLPLVITPFVFELTEDDFQLTLQKEEVAGVIWAPVEQMASGQRDGTYLHNRPKTGRIKLPSYEVDGKVIWGLTYMMLRNLFHILGKVKG